MLKHRMHKAEAVTGDRKTLHTDELHDLYFLPDIIRWMKWVGHMACMGHNANNVIMQVLFTNVMIL